MPPRFTRNSDRPRASDRTMVDTEDTRTRLQRFPTRSASSPSADEPHGWQQARAKPLERIGGHTYYSGLDVEKQSRSGQSGAFFLTFLFIELIDRGRECNRQVTQKGLPVTYVRNVRALGLGF